MVYKSINGLSPQYMGNHFIRNFICNSLSLRNTATDLRLPKKTSANRQKCFSYRGAKLWNNLPAETKQASSMTVFKHCFKIGWAFSCGRGDVAPVVSLLGFC